MNILEFYSTTIPKLKKMYKIMNDKLIITIIAVFLLLFVATNLASSFTSSLIYFLKSITRSTSDSI